MLRVSYRSARRLAVFVVGGTVSLFGLLLLVLPGPGLLFVFLGLSLLATEFVWARLWLRRLKVGARRAARRTRRWPWRRGKPPSPPPADPSG
jgi:tellurite resistance protein TerC